MKQKKAINIVYLASFGVIFLGVCIFLFFFLVKPFDIKKIDQIKEVTLDNYLSQQIDSKGTQTQYYVLVYSNESSEKTNIEESLFDYLNYERKNEEAYDVYVLYYDHARAEEFKTLFSIDTPEDTPLLFRVYNQKKSTSYDTTSKINSQLYSMIKED